MEDKRKGIEKILIDVYPKFLNALRDTYPLAFLGSFSILIASFLQNAPGAQEYAIAAAVTFLLAFLLSLMLKLSPASSIALMLYISFGAGMVLLIAVTNELSKACSLTPVVIQSTSGLFIAGIVSIVFWNWTSFVREEWFKRLQERVKHPNALVVALFVGSLGLLSIIIHLILRVYSVISRIEISGVIQNLTDFGFLLIAISVIAMLIMSRIKRAGT